MSLRVQPYAVADRDQVGGEIRSFGRPGNTGGRSWSLQGPGETAAEANFGAIRYESVRDPETDGHSQGAGRNVGLFSPEVFQHPRLLYPQA